MPTKSSMDKSVRYLGNEDAFILFVKGVTRMTFSSSTDTDAKFFAQLLVDRYLLKKTEGERCLFR